MKTYIHNSSNAINIMTTLSLLFTLFAFQTQAQNNTSLMIDFFDNIIIDTYNGNMIYERQDMLADGNMIIDISFTYNSVADTVDNGYGKGWFFNYGMSYSFDDDGNIELVRDGGRVDLFTFSNNHFVPPAGIFDDLLEYEPMKYKLTTKNGLSYFFDNPQHKKLTEITDPNGNSINITYQNGFPINVSNSSGNNVTLTWTASHLTGISFHDNDYSYEYEDGYLVKVINPGGYMSFFEYFEDGKMALATDYNNNPVNFTFLGSGKIYRLRSCDTELAISYVNNERYVRESAGMGEIINKYKYDDLGRIIKATYPDNNSVTIQYDDNDNVTQITDAKKNTYHFTYDDRGNMLTAVDPKGKSIQYSYNEMNRITSIMDKMGNQVFYFYDAKGNLLYIEEPGNVITGFLFNNKGNPVQMTDPLGNQTNYIWNDNDKLEQIIYPTGNVTFLYNNMGYISQMSDPNDHHLFFEYECIIDCNNFSKIKLNDSIYTAADYDGNGNIVRITDAPGNYTVYEYDELNRIISSANSAATVHYFYDRQNNLSKVSDAYGHSTLMTWDKKNRLISRKNAIGQTTTFQYDANNNLTGKSVAGNQVYSLSYDALNRMILLAHADNTDHYTYDAVGNLINVYNDDISMSFTYDARGRLLSKSIDNWNKTIYYTYNAAGNRASMTDPDGGVTYYSYDANNRLISLQNPFGEITGFEYDLPGGVTRQNNPNGTYSEYVLTDWGALYEVINKTANGELISKYTYTYDRNGNRVSMTVNDTDVYHYTYNTANQLIEVIYPWGETESFTYDLAGNRLTHTLDDHTVHYVYNEANQLIQAGDITYEYDERGNRVSKEEAGQTTSYIFNALNRLVGIVYPDGTENHFVYDPFGNRVAATDHTGQTIRFLLDGDNVLMELNQNGETHARYTSRYEYDMWLSMRKDNQSHYFHKDGMNSTSALTDDLGELSASYTYRAFGEIYHQTGNLHNPYTYTGREFDTQSGLYYYRDRYYEPQNGIFVSTDNFPASVYDPLSFNRYTYVANNPVNYVDPTGEVAVSVGVAVGVILGGGALVYNIYTGLRDMNEGNRRFTEQVNKSRGGEYKNRDYKDENDFLDHALSQLAKFDQEKMEKGRQQMIDGVAKLPGSSITGPLPTGPGDLIVTTIEESPNVLRRTLNAINTIAIAPFEIYYGLRERRKEIERRKWRENRRATRKHPPSGGSGSSDSQHFHIRAIASSDPNEVIGPPGYDSLQWVSINQLLPYRVLFENDPELASAPAQNVFIEISLDENLHEYDFRVGSFGFGSFIFEVPANMPTYYTRVDVRDSLGVFVDLTAGVNVQTRKAFWLFESIDPETGLAPEDAFTGFLPINDSLARGEGFVDFTIRPASHCQTLDSVQVQASIFFDDEAPIITNNWVNIVDALPPVSTISEIAHVNDNNYNISFTGSDDPNGCGLSSYELYVSRNQEPYLFYGEAAKSTSLLFRGAANSEYRFFSRAKDHVGNREDMKSVPDATLTTPSSLYAGPDAEICADNVFYISESASAGPNLVWTGGDGNFETQAEQIYYIPGEADILAGTVDLCLTEIDSNGDPLQIDCMTLTINPLPEVTCPDDMLIQFDELPLTLEVATPDGGFYSGADVENNVFNPQGTNIFGIRNVYYTYADEFGCTNQCSFTIRIDTVPPVYLNNMVVSAGEEHCHGSETTILTENYVVEPGGSVTLVSAVNIMMQPGTHIKQGAHLHAYIDSEAESLCEQPETLHLYDMVVTAGEEHCHGSETTILTENYVVEPSATVNLVSAVNIIMLPFTHIQQGAHLHAFIDSQAASFCEQPKSMLAADSKDEPAGAETTEAELNLPDRIKKQADFILYPNPTTGFFTLELMGGERVETGVAEVYSLMGELIFRKNLAGKHRWLFDLEDHPNGVYIVRVVYEDGMHAWRVIKR